MKINILEVANDFGLGGTQKTMQLSCQYLDKTKFNVYACGLYQSGVREKYIKPFVTELIVCYGDIGMLKQYITYHKIRIIHIHSFFSSKNKSSLDAMESLLLFCKSQKIRIVQTSPFAISVLKLDKLLDAKIFVSQTCLLKYLYLYGEKLDSPEKNKCFFIYNPLNINQLESYILPQQEITKMKRKLGIQPGDFVIGKVARADNWKWDALIIDLIPFVIQKLPHLKVIIRSIPEQMKKIVHERGFDDYFIYLPESGVEKDIAYTYQLMDVVFHTSRIGESFGLTLVEPMFFGKPVIVNSTDFMSWTIFDRDNAQTEIISNNINGFVENSLHEVADRLYTLKNDKKLYGKISVKNKRQAQRLYDGKIVVRKLEKILLGTYKKEIDTLSMEDYKIRVIPESFFDLLKINSGAIYDKIHN